MRLARFSAVAVLVVVFLAALVASSYLAPRAATTDRTSQSYQVEFVQESNCPYGSWLVPWEVVMDHQTVVQPSNATLPLSYAASGLTDNGTYSTIWFSLPSGTYAYTVLPNNLNGQEQSGNVTVNGGNVVVQVTAFVTAMGCSSTTESGR